MSTEETPVEQPAAAPEPAPSTPFHLSYAGASHLETTEAGTELDLFANLQREPVRFDGAVRKPLRFREAMAALYAVVGSDFRYVPKDRTAYMAYQRMRKESLGQGAWQAQQAYFSWLLRNDPLAFVMLDPIITVHPDKVIFEVFSKDEGTYAKLSFDRGGTFDVAGSPTHGTTNIDFSPALFAGVQQLRSFRATRLHIGREQVAMKTPDATHKEILEKKIQVPDTWLRGFLQVQSAATLPQDEFSLAPIDLYNLMRHLRMHGDKKGKRRGIRIELIPAEKPRLVLEPWELVLPSSLGTFKGKSPKVVRIWGRRRLLLLQRLLPLIESIDVRLLGNGLPNFWIFRAADFSMTVGLTGFTAANWSQAINFDLLLPRKTQTSKPLEAILAHLAGVWLANADSLSKKTGLKGAALVEALQLGCQQGKLMYDVAEDVYRLRPLSEAPLDLERLEYRNQRERVAHDLLVRRGAVKLTSENRIAGTGLELTGKVAVDEDKREYRPQLLLGDEAQVLKAECTCALYRKQGLKQGPCAHLIALRLAYAEQQRGKPSLDKVTMETRTFSKRDAAGEDVFQVSLEKQRLKLRWGRAGKESRLQRLKFGTLEEARAAYQARLADLHARGYLDATTE